MAGGGQLGLRVGPAEVLGCVRGGFNHSAVLLQGLHCYMHCTVATVSAKYAME
jgi:hypothetical protein